MSLASVFHFNEDYIHSFCINYNGASKTCLLEYTPWTYDLIDKDLDADEIEYDSYIKYIDRFVLESAKNVLLRNEYDEIIITKKKMIFRHEHETEFILQLSLLRNESKHTLQLCKQYTYFEDL